MPTQDSISPGRERTPMYTGLRQSKKRFASTLAGGAAVAVLIASLAGCGASASSDGSTDAPARVVHSSAAHPTVSPSPTPTPEVTTEEVSTTSPIAFTSTTVDDPRLARGTTAVATPGVNGVLTTTYRVTLTDGVETARTQISQVVTTQPVTQVTHVGTYVAPVAPPPPAPAPAAPSNLHRGEFCAKAMHGVTVDGLTCKPVDSNGRIYWRWE